MERTTKEFLRPGDLAPLLGVSRSRIYQLIAAGALPATRHGRSIRIPRAGWEVWLATLVDQALAGTKAEPGASKGR